MSEESRPQEPAPSDRRDFLATASSAAMAGGLVVGYGMFGAMAGQMLYSTHRTKGWVFVTDVAGMTAGQSMIFRTPTGAKVVVARQKAEDTAEAFAAFSSTCPHLGCQVHWESHQQRFFCPCHNGTFNAAGEPTGGPPLSAGQSLPRYPLKVENGLLYMEAPLESVTAEAARDESSAPLAERFPRTHDREIG